MHTIRFVGAGALLALVAACASAPNYPITQQQRSFSELNGAATRVAPNVAAGVTAERIANARAEPQNWLTYYGAYDGQRFSALDQINTGNVARPGTPTRA
jgi:alcohol dehydrogenase (cytochrome c)